MDGRRRRRTDGVRWAVKSKRSSPRIGVDDDDDEEEELLLMMRADRRGVDDEDEMMEQVLDEIGDDCSEVLKRCGRSNRADWDHSGGWQWRRVLLLHQVVDRRFWLDVGGETWSNWNNRLMATSLENCQDRRRQC